MLDDLEDACRKARMQFGQHGHIVFAAFVVAILLLVGKVGERIRAWLP